MAEWIKETPTLEFRILRKPQKEDGAWIVQSLKDRLQQRFKVARGGTGSGVEYTDEWRDIEIVVEDCHAVD